MTIHQSTVPKGHPSRNIELKVGKNQSRIDVWLDYRFESDVPAAETMLKTEYSDHEGGCGSRKEDDKG